MNQKSIYWLCQILGWSLFSLSELINYSFAFTINQEDANKYIGIGIVTSLVGIALTHLFRIYFKQFEWVKLPIPALIARSLLSIAIITVILTVVNIPLDSNILQFNNISVLIKDLTYLINLGKPVIIWVLIYVFFALYSEKQKEVLERMQVEASAKESEVKILRAQMNPHFIFNTLNSIRALVIEDPNKAQQGINQLSNILRSSLVADRQKTVSLKDEIKTVNDYLALEKIRYEDRLQITIDTSPETLSCQVPPMMIQTLVENGIKHGVQKARRWGFVEIKTKSLNNSCFISIRNTGELSNNANSDMAFGLKNTERRLKLIYGSEATFTIYQEDKLTVKAEIKIPIHYESINN